MKLVSITPARNEAPMLGLSLRALLQWVDAAVVLVHASTDNTLDIAHDVAAEYPNRVHILIQNDPVWREMRDRQMLLNAARQLRATHIAPVDADEVLTGNLLPTIRADVERLDYGRFLGIPMKNLHRSIHQYRSDNGIWGARAGTMLAFRDSPELSWQSTDGYDHHHRHPHGSRLARILKCEGGLMHLQFADWRRLTAKHALYKMVERVRWPRKDVAEIDRLYSLALNEESAELSPVPESWWQPYERHMQQHLHLGAEPWHEAECRRMWERHGAAYFNGLNLFAVVGIEVAA